MAGFSRGEMKLQIPFTVCLLGPSKSRKVLFSSLEGALAEVWMYLASQGLICWEVKSSVGQHGGGEAFKKCDVMRGGRPHPLQSLAFCYPDAFCSRWLFHRDAYIRTSTMVVSAGAPRCSLKCPHVGNFRVSSYWILAKDNNLGSSVWGCGCSTYARWQNIKSLKSRKAKSPWRLSVSGIDNQVNIRTSNISGDSAEFPFSPSQ